RSMTDALDIDLRDRLGRLGAAVPVTPAPALGTVPVVRVRRRPMAFGSLVPTLVLVVIGTALAGLAHIGPFATGSDGSNGSVSATQRSGEFTLEIHSVKARYSAGEPM